MSIGSLVVRIGADISGIQRDAKRGADSLGGMEKAARTLGFALKALVVGAAAKEMASLVSSAMDAIDTSAKLSRQLGGTINGLKGLQLAASDAGVDSGMLSTAMQKLNVKLGEAARKGAGPAYDALQRLGLSAQSLSAMDLDERMATIADAMRDAGLSSQGVSDSLANLGIRQTEVTRLMQGGGDAIRAATKAIDAMGLALSEVDAAKVEAANDAISRMKMGTQAFTQQLAVALAPVLQSVADEIVGMAVDTDSVKTAMEGFVTYTTKGFGVVADGVHAFELGVKAVSGTSYMLNASMAQVIADIGRGLFNLAQDTVVNVNTIIDTLNEIPGVSIPLIADLAEPELLHEMEANAKAMAKIADDVAEKYRLLTLEKWPSDKIEAWLARVREAATQAAETVVRERAKMTLEVPGGGAGGADDTKAADDLRKKLQQQLDVLREHAMSAEELENAHYEESLSQLNASLDAKLLSLAEYGDIAEELESKHLDALNKIREQGAKRGQDITVGAVAGGAKQITGMLLGMTAEAAKHSRRMFDIHKGLAIADAALSAAQGVATTLGSYQYPLNLIMAAAHAAVAGVQIGVIASQQYSGGGGGGVQSRGRGTFVRRRPRTTPFLGRFRGRWHGRRGRRVGRRESTSVPPTQRR